MNMRSLLATSMVALAALATQVAHADTVVNGNFATNDFTGWTLGGDTSNDFVGASTNTVDPSGPGFGNSAYLGTNGAGDTTMTQTLATVAGTNYVLSFFLQADSGSAGSVTTSIDGVNIAALSTAVSTTTDWATFSYQFTGTGSDTLAFDVSNDPSWFELTNISTTDVPEPATWALMLAGVAGVGYALRRRGGVVATFA